MLLRLLFILPKGNHIATPFRDQNVFYMLGRAIVEEGYLGPPSQREVGPYYEYRETHPPPLGAIPEIRLKMMQRWDEERHYYGTAKWGAPTSIYEPLYPLYSAFAYKLFGDRFLYHRLILALMSSFTCILVFSIGKRLFNEKTGYLSALICAFYPYFIFYTVFLMSETFFIFFLALSVYFLVKIKDNPNWKDGILFGISLGLTFLTRSVILGLLPFLLILLLIYNFRRSLVPVILTLFAFALTISPWVIRNYKLHHQVVILATRGGYNLWFRNNPFFYEDELAALGYKVPDNLLKDIKYRKYLDFPHFSPEQGEVERDKILTREGINFIRQNPRLFAYLCWIRFQTLIGFHGTLAKGLIYRLAGMFSFGILFPLALLTVGIYYKRWRETLPLILIFAFFLGFFTLTHDGIRYRLPADPYLIILASFFLIQLLEYAGTRFKKMNA
jgi:4-amino-4-deoxy-L-arabinose transferase-like glycosyltransferase